VTEALVEFSEGEAEQRTAKVPLSHLSVEVGHLYIEQFERGPDFLRSHFERVRPWAELAKRNLEAQRPELRPRVSTCFMIDDYFNPFSSPAKVIPALLDAARDAGVGIDYIARESACADTGAINLAEVVQGLIVDDPYPGTNGTRPPLRVTGWLSNGRRSPVTQTSQAMRERRLAWAPPEENAARRHSIFMDVELWDVDPETQARKWSCAFLAAVWQLLRLGVLRHDGLSAVTPLRWSEPADLPEEWADLPSVIQIADKAAPFCAYQNMSVLDTTFLPVESAVRTILNNVAVDEEALEQTMERSAGEDLTLPRELIERIGYVFLTRPAA
jgi:hypothetical protein